MRLTKKTNYAVRILMYCAVNKKDLSQVSEIANAYGLSEGFLFQIVRPLVTHGYLKTVRGRNGGIGLARDASNITLSEIARVTEEDFHLAECFKEKGTECPLVDACELNLALREALAAFFSVLDKYTINDLAFSRHRIDKLLGIDGHSGKTSADRNTTNSARDQTAM